METKDRILSVLTRQRQRYEEQMKTLYEVHVYLDL